MNRVVHSIDGFSINFFPYAVWEIILDILILFIVIYEIYLFLSFLHFFE